MAVMGHIAWADSNFEPTDGLNSRAVGKPSQIAEIFEFPWVFRGRALTPKERRIACGVPPVDSLIQGGIVRGRISEIIAEPGSGKVSLAAAFAANVTRHEAAAWIDTSDDFDPASIAAAGVELSRLLWVSTRAAPAIKEVPAGTPGSRNPRSRVTVAGLKAAEWILTAGGFGLVVLDFGISSQLPQSAALRLAHAAERSGASILVLAPHRMCGTFAALTLTLRQERACFSRLRPGGPVLFDGLILEACVSRNKLGKSGQTAKWKAVIENGIGPAANSPTALEMARRKIVS